MLRCALRRCGGRGPRRAWAARGLSDEAAIPLLPPIAAEPSEPAVAPSLLPRPGDPGALRRAPDEEVCGHLLAYRDSDGVRRVGVVRERKGREAWLVDHPDGVSIVTTSDADSFWRLRKPLRASSVGVVRREVSAILARVASYAEQAARGVEGAWASLALPEGERAEARNCRELVRPLFGPGGGPPTNLQLLAVHTHLSTDAEALVRFKTLSRGAAFVARPAEAVERARASLAQHGRFALSGEERVRMLLRLREAARGRDAAAVPALREAAAARKEAAAASREEQAAIAAPALAASECGVPSTSAALFGAEPEPPAASLPLPVASVQLRECLQCPSAKLPLFLPSTRILANVKLGEATAAALREASRVADAARAARAAASLPPAPQPDEAEAAMGEAAAASEAPAPAVAPFGACELELRVLSELRSFGLADDNESGYVTHEPLVALLLWPLCRKDRPFGALELLMRLGQIGPFANAHVLRAMQQGAAARAAAEAAEAEAALEPAAGADAEAGGARDRAHAYGLLDALPQWALDGRGGAEVGEAEPARAPLLSAPSSAPLQHGLSVVTIDGAEAEEIDDGLSAERAAEGGVWVHVHVANPTLRIGAASPLAELAFLRAKTVYLPEGSVPMLPPCVARGQGGTGLEPTAPGLGPPRSALTLSARVDESSGALLQAELAESSLPSVAALTYAAADQMLHAADAADAGDGGELLGSLQLLERVARARRARRMRAGGLSLCLPRPSARVCPERLDVRVSSSVGGPGGRSGALVEEMMVLAGEVCAELALIHKLPLAFRAQALPLGRSTEQEEALAALRAFSAAGGAPVAGADVAGASASGARGSVEHMVCSVGVIPLLRAATTSLGPAGGHASLGLRAYAQVTSPLRRSLDLLAHHQLRALLQAGGGGPLSAEPLGDDAFAAAAAELAELDSAPGGPLEAERAAFAAALCLPYSPAAVRARATQVSARGAQIDRLESASARYWTLQLLAQRCRDGTTDYEGVTLAREPAASEGAGGGLGSAMVLLPELGLRAWMRECDLPPGEPLRVRVHRIHAHRGLLGLQRAPEAQARGAARP